VRSLQAPSSSTLYYHATLSKGYQSFTPRGFRRQTCQTQALVVTAIGLRERTLQTAQSSVERSNPSAALGVRQAQRLQLPLLSFPSSVLLCRLP